MGELESEGSGDCKDKVEISFHSREKESDCRCGSDKCSCDSSCPNFKGDHPVLAAPTRREKIMQAVFIACIVIFLFAVYYFGLS